MRFYTAAAVLILTICSAGIALGESDPAAEQIGEGIRVYKSAIESSERDQRVDRFARAEAIFSEVIRQQVDAGSAATIDASLYTNLGNAALGAEHLGAAVAAYLKAIEIDPDDDTAHQNLQFARTLLPDWVPTPENEITAGSFFDVVTRLRNQHWYTMAAACFLASALCYAFALRTGRSSFRNLALAASVFWCVCMVMPLYRSMYRPPSIGVVVVPESVARSADSFHAPERFSQPLPDGTEFLVEESREEWLRFELFDGRTGWLPKSAVTVIDRTI